MGRRQTDIKLYQWINQQQTQSLWIGSGVCHLKLMTIWQRAVLAATSALRSTLGQALSLQWRQQVCLLPLRSWILQCISRSTATVSCSWSHSAITMRQPTTTINLYVDETIIRLQFCHLCLIFSVTVYLWHAVMEEVRFMNCRKKKCQTSSSLGEITNCKKQRPSWEANSRPAGQEISFLLWNLKVHYHVHKTLPLTPILSQMNSPYTLTTYFFEIHFNITLPSTPNLSSGLLFSGLQAKILYTLLISPMGDAFPTYLNFLNLITNNIWWRIQIMKHLKLRRNTNLKIRSDFQDTLYINSIGQ